MGRIEQTIIVITYNNPYKYILKISMSSKIVDFITIVENPFIYIHSINDLQN